MAVIEPTEADIGRLVDYCAPGVVEQGVITSFNAEWVFVRYGVNQTGVATAHKDLTWGVTDDEFYTCPTCHRRSYHPQDRLYKFCVVCGFEEDRKCAT